MPPDQPSASGPPSVPKSDPTGGDPTGELAGELARRHDGLLDLTSLERHLAGHGLALDRDFGARRFSRGFGNVNFLVRVDGDHAVLRRPPPGPLPRGANDMGREYLILSRIHARFPFVPRALHFCDDRTVLGVPFLLMEYCPGIVIADEMPQPLLSGWAGAEPPGAVLAGRMARLLAQLHEIPPQEVGLERLGKPDGFAERQVRGWKERALSSWDHQPPKSVALLVDWLESHAPEGSRVSLIHNDFKLDNIILDEATLAPRAVIDWDMGTLGHPLYDLAILLSYWTESADPSVMHDLRQMPTARHGFPGREAMARLYGEEAGIPLGDLPYFRVLASLRLAVVFRQIYRRYQVEGATKERLSAFSHLAEGLAGFGVDVARGRYF